MGLGSDWNQGNNSTLPNEDISAFHPQIEGMLACIPVDKVLGLELALDVSLVPIHWHCLLPISYAYANQTIDADH